MNRRRFPALLAGLVAGVLATAGFAGTADANKKKRKPAPAQKQSLADDEALGQLMGGFKFGMSQKQVLAALRKQIWERYDEKIKATAGIYEQDKLRKERDGELKRIQKTYTKFTGKKTGWDVSIIDDQFAHGTEESMMEYWENHEGRDQRRFFFFHNGELYKMVVALNNEAFKDKDFSFFQQILEQRYGPGKAGPGLIDWRSKSYHVQAKDKLRFYGTFVMVIGDPKREVMVAEARAAVPKAQKKNNVIEAMTGGDEEQDLSKANSNVIDQITR